MISSKTTIMCFVVDTGFRANHMLWVPTTSNKHNDTITSSPFTKISQSDVKHIRTIPQTEKKPVRVAKIKVIRTMVGSRQRRDSSTITCQKYQCKVISGGRKFNDDMVVFNTDSLQLLKTPPLRNPNSLWAFQSAEPPRFKAELPPKWDSMFNYSVTYVAGTDGEMYNFRDKLVKKRVPRTQSLVNQKKRKVRALWFVSHCQQPHRPAISSGRADYIKELSQYIPIDVFTRHSNCKEQFGSLVKEGPDPRIKDYPFYLAFENSLCKDYITEKLWKVLEYNIPTIPIVLGGLSVKDYVRVAPPNSFIHVRNFTSPRSLAQHLKFITKDLDAFNYYLQWRDKYILRSRGTFSGKSFSGCTNYS